MTDPLAPFDPALLGRVAADHGLEPAALAALVERHHDYAARVPGIDELVFEWRRAFPYEPLVARTADAYHLAVEPSVWVEFAAQLELEDGELAALRALHGEQGRSRAAERGDSDVFGERVPLLLAR